jgi:hypothetical protein
MLAGQGLAPDRYARYRSLLAAVGGHRVERLDGGQLEVTMFSAGLAPSSVVKDLVYAASPPAPLVADTDHDRPIHDPAVYAACDGAWYVHRSSN